MTYKERRKAARTFVSLLTAFRSAEECIASGFARTLNLSQVGALFESPDPFRVDQALSLEFLLDDDRILRVDGIVTRVGETRGMNHIAVAFPELRTDAKNLLAKQVESM
jgi:hypothetical protein